MSLTKSLLRRGQFMRTQTQAAWSGSVRQPLPENAAVRGHLATTELLRGTHNRLIRIHCSWYRNSNAITTCCLAPESQHRSSSLLLTTLTCWAVPIGHHWSVASWLAMQLATALSEIPFVLPTSQIGFRAKPGFYFCLLIEASNCFCHELQSLWNQQGRRLPASLPAAFVATVVLI